MGWVTLTLRKTELKQCHSDYQKELLDISRTKRQMARQYHYEQTLVRGDQAIALRNERAKYTTARDAINEQLQNENLTNEERAAIQNQLTAAQEDYQGTTNEMKMMYEDDLAMIEQEANDTETDLDQQQVEVEAQLEAISAEIEAVGEAISSQIQASTIKLSQ